MLLSLFDHALIKDLGPLGVAHRLSGPFDKGLSQEIGGTPTPMGPDLAATFLADRGHSGVFLQTGRVGILGAQRAKSGAQTRCQLLSRPRQIAEEVFVWMLGEDLPDP